MAKYFIWNKTDQVFAWPEAMSRDEAEKFCVAFRDKFKPQGFYKTADGRCLDPKDVELVISEVEK